MSSWNSTVIIPEGIRGLQRELTKLINNPEYSDVIFVCSDGIEVHGCRLLMSARSSFFSKLFQSWTAESRESHVSLPTVSSSVLLIVLHYLCTGELPKEDIHCPLSALSDQRGVITKMRTSDPLTYQVGGNFLLKTSDPLTYQLDWNLLLKVVVAARYFMLDCLESDILQILRSDLRAVAGGDIGIFHKLSALCQFPELWTGESEVKFLDEIGSELVRLASADSSAAALCFLSKEALEYYLAKIRKTFGEDEFWERSLAEYLRLRHMLLWCAVQNIRDVSSFDPVCLPGLQRVTEYLGKSNLTFPTVQAGHDTFSVDRETLVNAIEKQDLEPFLETVELSSIHAQLLLRVIEPLNIFDREALREAFVAQAVVGCRKWVRRPNYELHNYNAMHAPNYNGLMVPDCVFSLGKRSRQW